MPALKLQNFGGMVPIQDQRLIPDNFASFAQNIWLYSGRLQGYGSPQAMKDLVSPASKYAFRIPVDLSNVGDIANSVWMEFLDPDTTVVRAPLVGDEWKRYYWCSPGQPLQYNTTDRILAGQSAFLLGIPAPSVAPTAVPDNLGATPLAEARSYLYTWISAYGEEGQPSPPVVANANHVDDHWNITLTPPDVSVTTNRNITQVRIYRTVTSTTGQATFFEVTTLPIATTTFHDDVLSTTIAASLQLQSLGYAVPPVDLQGIIAMPNGMVVGWKADDLYFCEPYLPHAWPAAYDESVEYPIVGCGVFGTTLFVGTEGYPQAASGTHPSNITISKVQTFEPCLSRSSIVSAPEGVYYASENGLILANPGIVRNITRTLISRKEWNAQYDPRHIRAVRYGTAYVGFLVPTQPTGAGMVIDPIDQRVAFTNLAGMGLVQNIVQDAWTGEVFIISGGQILQFDPPTSTTDLPLIWRSKEFHALYKQNFAVCKIFFDASFDKPIDEDAYEYPTLGILDPDEKAVFRLWADRDLVMEREIDTNGQIIRWPSGFKADIWQFEIQSKVPVLSIHFATTVKELRTI